MIRLLEIIDSESSITIDDVMSIIDRKLASEDVLRLLRILEEYYYSDKKEEQDWAKDYINILNKLMVYMIEIGKKLQVPYLNIKYIKTYLLGQTEFKMKMEDFFPVPLYIAATKNADGDWADIGIMVDQTGNVLEIHEGNDESSAETIALANKLVNPTGKPVRIYAAHDTKIVQDIDINEYLPANLYVSPYLPHAQSYLDLKGERSLFTGIININDVSRESDLDWRTIGKTRINKFKWL